MTLYFDLKSILAEETYIKTTPSSLLTFGFWKCDSPLDLQFHLSLSLARNSNNF